MRPGSHNLRAFKAGTREPSQFLGSLSALGHCSCLMTLSANDRCGKRRRRLGFYDALRCLKRALD